MSVLASYLPVLFPISRTATGRAELALSWSEHTPVPQLEFSVCSGEFSFTMINLPESEREVA